MILENTNIGLLDRDFVKMTDSASAEVKLNIGVPGRIASGMVSPDTTVREALRRFGFEPRAHEIRGWARGGDSQSKAMTLDEVIGTDMTVLLLKPIAGNAQSLEDIVKSTIVERFGASGVRDIWIQPFNDLDEDPSLRITIVLQPATAKTLNGPMAIDLIGDIRQKLEEVGDNRFPVIEYATRSEIENSAVSA